MELVSVYQTKNLPTYTRHYYEYNANINSGKNYRETQLYKYSEQYAVDSEFKKIIEFNLGEALDGNYHYLYVSYGDLMKKDIISEIMEIIPKCESEELYIIAISCIECHCYSVLNQLIKTNISFNSIIPAHICIQKNYTLFLHAIEREDYEIIKYLVDNEIDISSSNIDAWISALSSVNENIFEYAQQFDFNISVINRSFCSYYEKICNENHINLQLIHKRLQYFLDKGIDVNEFYKNNNRLFYRCSTDILKILINNGLIINDNMINEVLIISDSNRINLDITEYLMKLGYRPNNETIVHVLKNLNLFALQLLTRYNVNLSEITEPPSNKIINGMVENGLDYTSICHYIMNSYADKYFNCRVLR
ncbi:hypothetical protein [Powai lake megavirus]|uniref:Ankyrin repeat protein n=1 Tax=Powai lake megavirus TaxID=1842663 RepID=A0A167R5N4_9VIRU|nr:hypothetical protein QJ849_gp174 [Powai lake megavirus]ANB50336.1 hypothetical protein [Powai lake megavirus]